MDYTLPNFKYNQYSVPPVHRLFDEFNEYSRFKDRYNSQYNDHHNGRHNDHHNDRSTRRNTDSLTFTPKFDIKENQNAYLLYGEFPGIDQKDIDIEFTDASTLTIKGRLVRAYGNSNNNDTTSTIKKGPLKVTVEDEEEEAAKLITDPSQVKSHKVPQEPDDKYWVKERSVGDFNRTFTFPARVNQDGVKATMKNGILNITVPKAKAGQGRKIIIE